MSDSSHTNIAPHLNNDSIYIKLNREISMFTIDRLDFFHLIKKKNSIMMLNYTKWNNQITTMVQSRQINTTTFYEELLLRHIIIKCFHFCI